VSWTGVV